MMRLHDSTMREGVRIVVQFGLGVALISIGLSIGFDSLRWLQPFGMFVAFVSMLIAANEWRMIATALGNILYEQMRGDVNTKLHQVIMTVQASESIAAGDLVSIDSSGKVRRARGSDG